MYHVPLGITFKMYQLMIITKLVVQHEKKKINIINNTKINAAALFTNWTHIVPRNFTIFIEIELSGCALAYA